MKRILFFCFLCIVCAYGLGLMSLSIRLFVDAPQQSTTQIMPAENDIVPLSAIPHMFTLYQTHQVSQYLQTYFPNTVAPLCDAPQQQQPDLFLVFVNQQRTVDEKYIPNDLVPLPKQYTKVENGIICMRVEAATAMIAMLQDAWTHQYGVVVTSGYRSYNVQAFILNNRLHAIGEQAYEHVALPGHSEHQLGVTADLSSQSIQYQSAAHAFINSAEGAWIEANAHRYGFVQSYPKGKKEITGYIYEPWHYRYVGSTLAGELKKENKTLTEYFQESFLGR